MSTESANTWKTQTRRGTAYPRVCAQVDDAVLGLFQPQEVVSSLDWVTSRLVLTGDSKVRGHYRVDLFPYVRAWFDAFDDDGIEKITIQAAAQLGKTAFAQACLLKTGACDPHPMAWGDADERSLRRVFGRMWRIVEGTPELATLAPPPVRQSSERLNMKTFLVHGAWPRSASSAADYGAKVVVKNETDKMEHESTDPEADFRYLLDMRTQGYVAPKIIQMSTPTLKGRSYIESQRLEGDNRRWLWPCPQCNHWQAFKRGNGHDAGGVRWKKLNGKHHAQTARETACYECEKCRAVIHEHQRRSILQAAQWVPEGQTIKGSGRLYGSPAKPGRHASFGPLPTIAALLPGISIGTVAEAIVEALTASPSERAKREQNVTNSWWGETYDPSPVQVNVSDLPVRLAVDEPYKLCPLWSRFVTLGCDVGCISGELIFHWWLSAWARAEDADRWGRRGQLVERGITPGERVFREQVRAWQSTGFAHADGGAPLLLAAGLIDSGDETHRIYEFCRGLINVMPSKGSSTSNMIGLFQLGFQNSAGVPHKLQKIRQLAGLGDLVVVNTERTQQARVAMVSGVTKRDSADFYSIPADAFSDAQGGAMCSELISDQKDPLTSRWERTGPNEWGDAWRYSLVAAEWVGTRGGAQWNNFPPRSVPEVAARQRALQDRLRGAGGGNYNRDGRSFVASQR